MDDGYHSVGSIALRTLPPFRIGPGCGLIRMTPTTVTNGWVEGLQASPAGYLATVRSDPSRRNDDLYAAPGEHGMVVEHV